MLGESNGILDPSEKEDGQTYNNRIDIRDFHAFLDDTETIDLGFVKSPYLWSNNRKPPNNILERLDRCGGNQSWLWVFGDHTVHRLPRLGSNHCPILLTDTALTFLGSRRFRFENMWLMQPGFHEFVQLVWEETSRTHAVLSDKLASLATQLHA